MGADKAHFHFSPRAHNAPATPAGHDTRDAYAEYRKMGQVVPGRARHGTTRGDTARRAASRRTLCVRGSVHHWGSQAAARRRHTRPAPRSQRPLRPPPSWIQIDWQRGSVARRGGGGGVGGARPSEGAPAAVTSAVATSRRPTPAPPPPARTPEGPDASCIETQTLAGKSHHGVPAAGRALAGRGRGGGLILSFQLQAVLEPSTPPCRPRTARGPGAIRLSISLPGPTGRPA